MQVSSAPANAVYDSKPTAERRAQADSPLPMHLCLAIWAGLASAGWAVVGALAAIVGV